MNTISIGMRLFGKHKAKPPWNTIFIGTRPFGSTKQNHHGILSLLVWGLLGSTKQNHANCEEYYPHWYGAFWEAQSKTMQIGQYHTIGNTISIGTRPFGKPKAKPCKLDNIIPLGIVSPLVRDLLGKPKAKPCKLDNIIPLWKFLGSLI